MEATEHELLQRELECSMAMLHETVLKKVKEATVSFTKNLKSVTNSNIIAMKRRLNDLKNINNQGINNQDIATLEHDILEIETNWIKNQISEDKNYSLLEDEKPSRSFLNMESGKGGYSNITLLRKPNPHYDCNNHGQQMEYFHLTDGLCIRETVAYDFKKIYKSQENIRSSMQDLDDFLNSDGDTMPKTHMTIRRLPDHQSRQLEGEITEDELKSCLFKNMKGGVSSWH